jgi:cbb3-type cytochrome oxidase subunit 3
MYPALNYTAMVLGFLCICYLLISPHNRIAFAPARFIGSLLFPRLDPYRQQQQMAIVAGVVVAIIVFAEVIIFAINKLNKMNH